MDLSMANCDNYPDGNWKIIVEIMEVSPAIRCQKFGCQMGYNVRAPKIAFIWCSANTSNLTMVYGIYNNSYWGLC